MEGASVFSTGAFSEEQAFVCGSVLLPTARVNARRMLKQVCFGVAVVVKRLIKCRKILLVLVNWNKTKAKVVAAFDSL